MKKIGNQIFYTEGNNELYIEIKSAFDKNKYNLVLIWFVAWTACGVAVISQFFFDYSKNEKLFMVVFLALWAYFEFHVLNALSWRRSGKERIKVSEQEIRYVKEVGGRGIEKVYETEKCTSLKYQSENEEGFLNSINQSSWMIGIPVLEFTAHDNVRRIGIQLSKTDAEQLAKKINYFIK